MNILYVRGGNAGTRTIRVHKILGMMAVTAAIALVVSAAVIVATHSSRVSNRLIIKNLESENGRLHSELARFRGEVEALENKMNMSFELQNRARLIASLDPISSDVWQVGVGGPAPDLKGMESAYPDSIFGSIDEGLDRMLRQSELQIQSYAEVIGILDKEKEIRDCTPSIRPLKGGFLSSRFGGRMDPFTGATVQHPGIDYRARTGNPVMSTADGIVCQTGRNGGYGLMIEIEHGNGFKTRYAHLSKILVNRGQKVKRGEIIALVGNTGHSTGSHLHYEVLFRKIHRDPLQYVISDGTCYD
ncbi:MAG: M23 family metallopeptidase [Candidatus Krumholzibacteria bacterium]|nr:M23 family metallopeptidase [Candidatus Krumholzibacteria bacterium]